MPKKKKTQKIGKVRKIKKIKKNKEKSNLKKTTDRTLYKSSSFKAPQETASEIHLNEEELSQIRALELSSEQYSLELTRDLFMFLVGFGSRSAQLL